MSTIETKEITTFYSSAPLDYLSRTPLTASIRMKGISDLLENHTTNNIKIPYLTFNGLQDYNRKTGADFSTMELVWDNVTLKQDRSARIFLDQVDAMEQAGFEVMRNAIMRIMLEVSKELDAYRISKWSAGYGDEVAINKDNILDELSKAMVSINDRSMMQGNRYLIVTPFVYSLMQNHLGIVWNESPAANNLAVTQKIATYNGFTVVQAQTNLMYSKIDLLPGGGFAPGANAKPINFIALDENSVWHATALNDTAIGDKNANSALNGKNGASYFMRIFHDAGVVQHLEGGVYTCMAPAATAETASAKKADKAV